MFTISKEFHFSASHQLHGLREGHQCGRIHGHNYILVVRLSSQNVGFDGFVLDYGDLAPVKNYIDDKLDHRHLNDVLGELGGPEQPSSELMVQWFAIDVIPGLVGGRVPLGTGVSVGLSETPKTWAWFE